MFLAGQGDGNFLNDQTAGIVYLPSSHTLYSWIGDLRLKIRRIDSFQVETIQFFNGLDLVSFI